TDSESWIDHITVTEKASKSAEAALEATSQPHSTSEQTVRPKHPLLNYAFTNELRQAVWLSEFPGQGLAITFFFTRCPIPEFCPRLSKNFEEASQKLSTMLNAPTNWHFLSVTFDPEFDTPAMLKAYGERYQYDPAHWSFITGPTNKIGE